MNIVDIIIIILLIMGGALGFKNGVIKTATSFIGTFAIIVLSFMFKSTVSEVLYQIMPFGNFWGAVKGIQVINIIFYEVLAFILVFAVLSFILHIILVVTGVFEKILKMTVILSLPSKILGFVVGVLQYYTYIFIALFILSLPMFHMNEIRESTFALKILEETPVISEYATESVELYEEVYNIAKNRNKKSNEQDKSSWTIVYIT